MGFTRKVSSVPFGRVCLVPKFLVFARVHPQKSDAKYFCCPPALLQQADQLNPDFRRVNQSIKRSPRINP
jgi:hypothetical protein